MNDHHIALALIFKHGQIAVAWRNSHDHQGGCYELPGGKIELEENAAQAAVREVQEELELAVQALRVWTTLRFTYPDRTLSITVVRCSLKHPSGGNARLIWMPLSDFTSLDFPKANATFMPRFRWSRHLTIVPISKANQIVPKHVESSVSTLRATESSLYYLRQWSLEQIKTYLNNYQHVLAQQGDHAQCLKLIVRADLYLRLSPSEQACIFAAHLTHNLLHHDQVRECVNDICCNITAACHSSEDIAQANRLGLDAIWISPVHSTPTHQSASGIGWDAFARLTQQADMPVYALGGVKRSDLTIAQHHGAYGVAGIRDFI